MLTLEVICDLCGNKVQLPEKHNQSKYGRAKRVMFNLEGLDLQPLEPFDRSPEPISVRNSTRVLCAECIHALRNYFHSQ